MKVALFTRDILISDPVEFEMNLPRQYFDSEHKVEIGKNGPFQESLLGNRIRRAKNLIDI